MVGCEAARAVATECGGEQIAVVVGVVYASVVGEKGVTLIVRLAGVGKVAGLIEGVVGGIIITPLLVVVTYSGVEGRVDRFEILVIVGIYGEKLVGVLLWAFGVIVTSGGVIGKAVPRH